MVLRVLAHRAAQQAASHDEEGVALLALHGQEGALRHLDLRGSAGNGLVGLVDCLVWFGQRRRTACKVPPAPRSVGQREAGEGGEVGWLVWLFFFGWLGWFD